MNKIALIFSFLLSYFFVFSQQQTSSAEDSLFEAFSKKYKKAISLKGDYPYMNEKQFFEVVYLGEKYLDQYPKGKKAELVKDYLAYAVDMLADIHIIDNDGITSLYHLYVNNTNEFLGTMNFLNDFIEKYPDSKFTEPFKKIQASPSVVRISENQNLPDKIYFVVVGQFSDAKKLNRKKLEYFMKGFDIPHTFVLNKDNSNSYVLVYRFYDDYSKAKKALDKIKNDFSQAYIITGKVNQNRENKSVIYFIN